MKRKRREKDKRKVVNLSGIEITEHALKRFQERWQERFPEIPHLDWEIVLHRLLFRVKEIKKKRWSDFLAHLKYRRGARYFFGNGWIFVTNVNARVLFTVERLDLSSHIWKK